METRPITARYEQTPELLAAGRRLLDETAPRRMTPVTALLLLGLGYLAYEAGADFQSAVVLVVAAAFWSGAIPLVLFRRSQKTGPVECTIDDTWLRFRGIAPDDVSWWRCGGVAEDDENFVLRFRPTKWRVVPKSGFTDAGAVALFRALAASKVPVKRVDKTKSLG